MDCSVTTRSASWLTTTPQSALLCRRLRRRPSLSRSPLQQLGDRRRDSNRPAAITRYTNTMTQLTSISSRKRPSPNDHSPSDSTSISSNESTKRRRTISPGTAAPLDRHLNIPSENAPPTPPVSAKETNTMPLKLVIPREQISLEQQRKLNRHRADAERWKPKLQRPYPRRTEIKLAYPLKLMRHYPGASTSADSNFIRPKIDKSPRVSRLLEQFPLIDTTQPCRGTSAEHPITSATLLEQAIPLSARMVQLEVAQNTNLELQANTSITRAEHAQRLAWKSFAQTEHERIDRGREAMMQSGLLSHDLKMEASGLFNGLPEWKKAKTGRFALERLAAD